MYTLKVRHIFYTSREAKSTSDIFPFLHGLKHFPPLFPKNQWLKTEKVISIHKFPTVDGWNPAPPGMYETL